MTQEQFNELMVAIKELTDRITFLEDSITDLTLKVDNLENDYGDGVEVGTYS